jgi:hypothetical protein
MMGGLCCENGRWKDLKKRILMGNFIKPDHIARPVGKPRTRWEAVVQRERSQRMEETSRRHRRMEVSSEGGQGP